VTDRETALQEQAMTLAERAVNWAIKFLTGKAYIAVGQLTITTGEWTDEQLAKRNETPSQ
jgi:hypothetical protein